MARRGKPIKHYDKWRIRWLDETGQRRSETHGRYQDAVNALNAHERRVAEFAADGGRSVTDGSMPFNLRPFSDVIAYWAEHKLPTKSVGAQRSDLSIINVHLRPCFGEMEIAKIGAAGIDAFRTSRRHLDPKTLANILTLLISMLNVALDLGWIAKCPKIKKPKSRKFSSDVRYLRTNEEVTRFLITSKAEGEKFFVLYATAIYTGMREGELAGLLKSHIDFERRLITVQFSFSGPTKSNQIRYVPILDPLLPILRLWVLKTPGRLVFPNEAGRMFQSSAHIFQEAVKRILDKAGFPKLTIKGKIRHYITFHCFRHTFASHWMMNGGCIFKLQKILGHQSITMTQRYAHLAPSAFEAEYGLIRDFTPSLGLNVIHLSQ